MGKYDMMVVTKTPTKQRQSAVFVCRETTTYLRTGTKPGTVGVSLERCEPRLTTCLVGTQPYRALCIGKAEIRNMDIDKTSIVDSILSLFTKDGLLSGVEEDNYRRTLLSFFDEAMTAGANDPEEQDDQLLTFFIVGTYYILHNMSYAMFLKTRYWQNRRNKSLDLAGHKCQLCNASQSLQVHHRTYERRGNENDSDLIVLCKSCHQLFHDNKRISRKRG